MATHTQRRKLSFFGRATLKGPKSGFVAHEPQFADPWSEEFWEFKSIPLKVAKVEENSLSRKHIT